MQGKTYLVTGGSGFIATHLLRALLSEDVGAARVVDLVPPKVEDSRVQWLEGVNITDPAEMMSAAEGVAGIFHMGVLPMGEANKHPLEAIRVNIEGTLNVAAAAKEQGAKVVYSSASSVYGDTEDEVAEHRPFNPANFYGATKGGGELILRAAHNQWGIPIAILRYMNVYGPGTNAGLIPTVIRKIKAGEAPQLTGDGSSEFDFIYVGDVAQANLAAMESSVANDAFNVGSGEKATTLQVARKLLELAGSDLEPTFVPEQTGAVKRRIGSNLRLIEVVGWHPTVSLEEGLKRTWASFQ